MASLAHVRENGESALNVFVIVELVVEVGQVTDYVLRDTLYRCVLCKRS